MYCWPQKFMGRVLLDKSEFRLLRHVASNLVNYCVGRKNYLLQIEIYPNFVVIPFFLLQITCPISIWGKQYKNQLHRLISRKHTSELGVVCRSRL